MMVTRTRRLGGGVRSGHILDIIEMGLLLSSNIQLINRKTF